MKEVIQELLEVEKRAKAIVADAEERARQLLVEARQQAERQAEEIRKNATEEAHRLVAHARQQALAEKTRRLEAARKTARESAVLSQEAAEAAIETIRRALLALDTQANSQPPAQGGPQAD